MLGLAAGCPAWGCWPGAADPAAVRRSHGCPHRRTTARHQHFWDRRRRESQQAEQEAGRRKRLFAHRLSRAILRLRYLLSQSISAVFASSSWQSRQTQPCQTPPWHTGVIALWWQAPTSLCGEGEGGRRDGTPAADALGLILCSLPRCEAAQGRGLREGPQREEHQSLCITRFPSQGTAFNLTESFLVMLCPSQHSINQRLTRKETQEKTFTVTDAFFSGAKA